MQTPSTRIEPAGGAKPPGPGAADDEALLEDNDDTVIGRAMRLSMLALLLIGAAAGGGWYLSRRKPPAPPEKITQLSAPVARQRHDAQMPVVKFTDITAAGIDFVHYNGTYGEKLLPETMGGGVAFFDCDSDGDPDLLFTNGTDWPGKAKPGAPKHTARLYRNDGKGNFHDATKGSGLDVPMYGMGVACGDYDNDGDADVFLTGVGGSKLFRNDLGGHFTDITAPAGVGGSPDDWTTSAAFLDYDNDGRLDLFVCNYVRWTADIDREVNYTLVGVGRAYGPPTNFQGAFSRLYHNDGAGRFTDVSDKAGIRVKNPATGVPAGKSLGVAPVDLDRDGFIDLVVANDTVQNFVFINQKNGTFKECGVECGIAFDTYGNARGAMGIDTARFRNEDPNVLGVAIGNFANEMTALYVSQGGTASNLFTDEAIAEGVGPASRLPLKFGVSFIDYDLDGWLDLLTANGHLEEEISKVQESQKYKQPAQLFWNAGPSSSAGGFALVPPEKAGADLYKPIVGRGSAVADIDGDGDDDVVLTQINGAPLLLRNDQALGNKSLRLKLIGTKGNADAVGAWVKVTVGPQTLWRQVMPTRSYLSQSDLAVTVGLGKSAPDSVEVVWPNGQTQKVEGAAPGKLTVVRQAP
jgi:hypothetical protein